MLLKHGIAAGQPQFLPFWQADAFIQAFPAALQFQFWTFIADCTRQVQDIQDPTYFEIEIYEVVAC